MGLERMGGQWVIAPTPHSHIFSFLLFNETKRCSKHVT